MSDPITAISTVLSGVLGIAEPIITRAQAQAHETKFIERCTDIETALNAPDGDEGGNTGLVSLTASLCVSNGYPTAGDGPYRAVPSDFLESLLSIAAARERDVAKMNDLLEAITK